MSCAHFIPDGHEIPIGTCAVKRFPHGKAGLAYCNSGLCHLREDTTASALAVVGTAIKAGVKWFKAGMPIASIEDQASRRAICDECPMWDSAAFGGRGKCRKCGCGGLKLKLATEKCPLGKW